MKVVGGNLLRTASGSRLFQPAAQSLPISIHNPMAEVTTELATQMAEAAGLQAPEVVMSGVARRLTAMNSAAADARTRIAESVQPFTGFNFSHSAGSCQPTTELLVNYPGDLAHIAHELRSRSEERRVGKELRS